MSRSHGRATAHNFTDFAQNFQICMHKLEQIFLACSHTYEHVNFCVFLKDFLEQHILSEVSTAQENQHFEFLDRGASKWLLS